MATANWAGNVASSERSDRGPRGRHRPRVEIGQDSVTVAAGIRFGEIVGAGRALRNLGSLPHLSVAGACATGPHGSEDGNRVLGAYVRELDVAWRTSTRSTRPSAARTASAWSPTGWAPDSSRCEGPRR